MSARSVTKERLPEAYRDGRETLMKKSLAVVRTCWKSSSEFPDHGAATTWLRLVRSAGRLDERLQIAARLVQ